MAERNFHTVSFRLMGVWHKTQFPHPLFLKGWKFVFVPSGAVEKKIGELVEIGRNRSAQNSTRALTRGNQYVGTRAARSAT
jgi:hypothetical protein